MKAGEKTPPTPS